MSFGHAGIKLIKFTTWICRPAHLRTSLSRSYSRGPKGFEREGLIMADLDWVVVDAGVPFREMVTGLLSGDHCGVFRVMVSSTMVVWCECRYRKQRQKELV